jgi:hypothetical protein
MRGNRRWMVAAIVIAAALGAAPAWAKDDAAKAQAAAKAKSDGPFARPGFKTVDDFGSLWVFRKDDPRYKTFKVNGSLKNYASATDAGPCGATLKAPDRETIDAYLAAKPGFATRIENGVVLVAREGEESQSYTAEGRAGERNVRATDEATLNEYLASKPGFVVKADNGKIWVARDAAALDGDKSGWAVRENAMNGATVSAPNEDTLLEYLYAKPFFATKMEKGRLWVLWDGSWDHKEFLKTGTPEKSVTKIGKGPDGVTLRSVDHATADAYIASKS